jgi:hypothetical protein
MLRNQTSWTSNQKIVGTRQLHPQSKCVENYQSPTLKTSYQRSLFKKAKLPENERLLKLTS